MTKTEIKKEMYKQKPVAHLNFIRKGVAYYKTFLTLPLSGNQIQVDFQVPIIDMGDADFLPTMEGKLLNRWIIG